VLDLFAQSCGVNRGVSDINVLMVSEPGLVVSHDFGFLIDSANRLIERAAYPVSVTAIAEKKNQARQHDEDWRRTPHICEMR
jgi:hypothetical protein